MAKGVKLKSPNQRAREQARQERESRERRKRLMMIAGGAALTAVLALIVVGALTRGGSPGIPPDVHRQGKVLGSETAKVTLTAWEDFQCPFCKQANDNALAQVIKDYVQPGLVKVEYRHYAFLGDESVDAAAASECAAEQHLFWEYHDALFAAQKGENKGAFSTSNLEKLAGQVGLDPEDFKSCLSGGRYESEIKAERKSGDQLNIDSTPVFFVNGTRIEGAQPYSVFKAAIDKALAP